MVRNKQEADKEDNKKEVAGSQDSNGLLSQRKHCIQGYPIKSYHILLLINPTFPTAKTKVLRIIALYSSLSTFFPC